jgi:hypothetical protein
MPSRRPLRGRGLLRRVQLPVPSGLDRGPVRARRGRVLGDCAVPQRGHVSEHGRVVRVRVRNGLRGEGLRDEHGRLRVV